ncbi:MAG: hypothetical protein Q7S98_02420 [Deltaproteobacteria bacterium]|nr:hypothetical protein [Deltaproteobacteria bacterium]
MSTSEACSNLAKAILLGLVMLSGECFGGARGVFKDPAERNTVYGGSFKEVFEASIRVVERNGHPIQSSSLEEGKIKIAEEPPLVLALARGHYGGVTVALEPPDLENEQRRVLLKRWLREIRKEVLRR